MFIYFRVRVRVRVRVSGSQHVRLSALWGGCVCPHQQDHAGAQGGGNAAHARGDERPRHRGHLPQVGLSMPRQGAAPDPGD